MLARVLPACGGHPTRQRPCRGRHRSGPSALGVRTTPEAVPTCLNQLLTEHAKLRADNVRARALTRHATETSQDHSNQTPSSDRMARASPPCTELSGLTPRNSSHSAGDHNHRAQTSCPKPSTDASPSRKSLLPPAPSFNQMQETLRSGRQVSTGCVQCESKAPQLHHPQPCGDLQLSGAPETLYPAHLASPLTPDKSARPMVHRDCKLRIRLAQIRSTSH